MPRSQAGLTLVELMVTLVVGIILLGAGAVSYQRMQANNAAVAQANSLVAGVALARSEAVKRNATVAICPKAAASTTCGAAGDWINGWLVFVDKGGTTGAYDAGTDTLLRQGDALPGSPLVTSTVTNIRFGQTGEKATTADDTIQLSQTDATSGLIRCVTVNVVGHVRTESGSCP